MEAPDIIPRLKAFHETYDFNVIGIETVQFQLSALQYARREGLPVREIARKKSDDVLYFIDADKSARAMRATPLMADGRFWIPAYKPWLAAYVDELTKFPNANHDDQVDVTAYGVVIGEAIPTGKRPSGGKNNGSTNGDGKDLGVPRWMMQNQRDANRARRYGKITNRDRMQGLVPGR